MSASNWTMLRNIAHEETSLLIDRLPAPVRAKIRDIPIIFEPRPARLLVAGGVDPDVMGLFVGDDYPHGAQDPVATEIFLFLLNIWEEAHQDLAVYRAEIRTTLLHEWGHYLGLNEAELNEREL